MLKQLCDIYISDIDVEDTSTVVTMATSSLPEAQSADHAAQLFGASWHKCRRERSKRIVCDSSIGTRGKLYPLQIHFCIMRDRQVKPYKLAASVNADDMVRCVTAIATRRDLAVLPAFCWSIMKPRFDAASKPSPWTGRHAVVRCVAENILGSRKLCRM